MRRHSETIIKLSVLLSLILFWASIFFSWESLWGYNYPVFMDGGLKYLFVLLPVPVIFLLFIPKTPKFLENLILKIDRLIWGRNIIFPIYATGILGLLFFWFRLKTYFLGDGYTCISIFENPHSYIHKSTEYLSTYVVRFVQFLIGDYSQESSLLAFKLLSFISGFITIFLIFFIVKRLFKTSSARVLAMATLLFSGSILLFFGYVEFYPILWAAVALYLYFAVRFLENRKGLIRIILTFIIAVGMHAQAVYLVGGIALLILYKYYHKESLTKLPKKIYLILGTIAVGGAGLIIWKIVSRIEFALHFLPFYSGRPRTPGYGIFSPDHLYDILNQSLLILPGIIILITIVVILRPKLDWRKDWKLMFFILSSVGSLLFLFIIEPYIGMARDWDLMSLTLLMPALLLLYIISKSQKGLSPKIIISYCLLCLVITSSFVTVNIKKDLSEKRCYSLLTDDNDNRSRNGWLILTNYYFGNGNSEKAKDIMAEMNRRFPQYVYLDQAYNLISQGNYAQANQIAQSLISRDPYNIRFLELVGNIHIGYQQFDDALDCYNRALAMNPYSISIRNNLGIFYLHIQNYSKAIEIFEKLRLSAPTREDIIENLASAYINLKQYDSANLLADSLFKLDKNSPTAHVIMLSSTTETGNFEKAKVHYQEFIKYASSRPDYQTVLKYFKNLSE